MDDDLFRLLNACRTGNLSLVRSLLDEYNHDNSFINQADGDGVTPLIAACYCRRKEIICELLTRGADANLHDDHQFSHVRVLLSWFRKTRESDDENEIVDMAEMLLEAGANPNPIRYVGQESLLLQAYRLTSSRIADTLLNHGARFNKGELREILEQGIKSQRYLDAARDLIACGDDIEEENAKGWTPLMVAVMQHKFSNVQMILLLGANINHINSRGETALSCAFKHRYKLPCIDPCQLIIMLYRAGGIVSDTRARLTRIHFAGMTMTRAVLFTEAIKPILRLLHVMLQSSTDERDGVNACPFVLLRCFPEIVKYIVEKSLPRFLTIREEVHKLP